MRTKTLMLSLLSAVWLTLSLGACHRNYKVQYARVPVDSVAMSTRDTLSTDDWQRDPLFEDIEYDGNIKDKSGAMDDYDKFIHGSLE